MIMFTQTLLAQINAITFSLKELDLIPPYQPQVINPLFYDSFR